ncbi:uncharacterized protein LOC128708568 [Anopheles marshallii]|uniref:uncharacterized protein LOC128708568 n=1 Tax=Anopheles marshallii TaxID=1521116 RepID=UPI00237B72A1|nr:uncharacterized protein LOC128708568 [Anopheles marshallii]
MAESKQAPLSELVEPKREGEEYSPAASPADTTEDTTDEGQDGASCSPARESAEAAAEDDEKGEAKATYKQEAETADEESTPNRSVKETVGEKVAAAAPAAPEDSSVPKQEIVSSELVTVKVEGETKEPTPPVTMAMQQTVVPGDDGDGGGVDDANSEPKVSGAAVELKGESRKRSQSEHSRRSRSSSSSSTSSNGNSTSAEGRSNTSHSGGSSSQCSSNSDSEGVSAAKKVKLEPVLEEPSTKRAEEDQEKTETVDGVGMDEVRARSESPRCAEMDGKEGQGAAIAGPEEQPTSGESLNLAVATNPCSPSAPSAPAESSPIHGQTTPKMEQQQQNGREEGNNPDTLLLPPPPPPPPPPPATPSMHRIEAEVARTAVGKLSVVAPILERPDSARLTADLQSCQRQLAEVRSKYDVTRKELHATKRKLKRMSVRLGTMTGGGGGSAAPGGATAGNASPHPLTVGPADEDRNRKWREPMIVAAMKIKTAMGIQAYKSLIKDGELLLPSLRTITRYLESLRKAGGGGAAAAALANAGAAAVPKMTGPIEVDDVPEEDDDEEDEEEVDGVVRVDGGVLQRRAMDHAGGKRKQPKANGGGTGRTVDHNRNEQRRHPPYSAHRHHAPDVQLQDIKTEPDPVSFTASPDINYYQHNADDDDDEDEDGYQDPTSLLEESRYGEAGGMHLNGEDGSYHYGQQGQQPQQQQTLSQAQIEFLKSMVGFRKKWTPYELRTCNDIRRIIGSREYESLRRKDGMPLPSVKTLRKYRHAAHLPDGVDVMGRKRKLNDLDDSPTNQSRTVPRYGSGGSGAEPGTGPDNGSGVLFPFGNDTDKELLKPEHDPDGGHFDVSILTLPQISFLQTLTMNTKGFSDYELQRSLELKNELGSGNYETLRKQEFLNIPTLAMLTRYEQDNGLEDLSRLNGRRAAGNGRKRHKSDESALELVQEQEERRNRELEEQQAREQQQQEQEQEQQRQLELYNRLTQADPSRHPLFDSIAGDTSPIEGVDPALTAAAIASAMAAAAAAGLHHPQLDHLNGSTAGGEDSSMSMFEHHSIFDKDTPMFDMTKLSPAHVEFLNTLPENPKRWTQEMINSALDIKNEIGTRDYEILRRQGIPLPAARTLRRHKDIRNKADRAMSETGEILPGSGSTTPAAGVVGGSG